MICREGSKGLAAKPIIVTKSKGELMYLFLMRATVMGACIASSKIILDNLTAAGSFVMLLLGIAIFVCCIRYMTEEFILVPQCEKLREDTMEYAKNVHVLNNDELIKYFIINTCPQVKYVYLKDDNSVCLKGKQTMHFVEFSNNGAEIFSEKKDYRADKEANAIMKFLAEACN